MYHYTHKLLALITNIIINFKKCTDKHSSLLQINVSDEENTFYLIDTRSKIDTVQKATGKCFIKRFLKHFKMFYFFQKKTRLCSARQSAGELGKKFDSL